MSDVLEHVDKDPGKRPGGSRGELPGEISDDCGFGPLRELSPITAGKLRIIESHERTGRMYSPHPACSSCLTDYVKNFPSFVASQLMILLVNVVQIRPLSFKEQNGSGSFA